MSRRSTVAAVGAVAFGGCLGRSSGSGENTATEPSPDDDEPAGPQASFDFEYRELENSTGTLTVTHEDGAAITGDELYIRGESDGDSLFASWASVAAGGALPNSDGQVSGEKDGTDAVTSGDYVEFDVATGASVRVVWLENTGGQETVLDSWDGPDA